MNVYLKWYVSVVVPDTLLAPPQTRWRYHHGVGLFTLLLL
jgi:hypothetical protein